jgi:hypothetical protein
MAVEEYYDNIFKTATGWLGWVPEVALTTTISQIELAMEGKIDFIKKTNPFGGKEDEETKYWSEGGGVSDPEIAMKQIVGLVHMRQNQDRLKAKPNVSGGRRRRND